MNTVLINYVIPVEIFYLCTYSKGVVNFEDSLMGRGRSPSPTKCGHNKPVWQDDQVGEVVDYVSV